MVHSIFVDEHIEIGFNTISDNKYEFYLSGTSTYGSNFLSSTDVILNEWVHVIGTSDNTTRKIYLNVKRK